MKKRGISKRLFSVIITSIIISLLFVSGPARAITVGIEKTGGTGATVNEGRIAYFTGKIDFHNTDQITIDSIIVLIDDTPNDGNLINGEQCKFYVNGTAFEDNADICSITFSTVTTTYTLLGTGYDEGYASGYGYSYGTGIASTTSYNFDNGTMYNWTSGTGYDTYNTAIGSGAEIIVNFNWLAPLVASSKAYKVGFGILAGQSLTDNVLFMTPTASDITVSNVASIRGVVSDSGTTSSPSSTPTTHVTSVVTQSPSVPKITLTTDRLLTDSTVDVEEFNTAQEANMRIATPVESGRASAVYKYLKITPSADVTTALKEAKIEFTVDRNWLAENGLSERDIVLMRFTNGVWVELPTVVLTRTTGEVIFQATTPGFSYFAISVRKTVPIIPPVQETEVVIPDDACPEIITLAYNPVSEQCAEYMSPCDVPDGWKIVNECPLPPLRSSFSLTQRERLAVFLGVLLVIVLVLWLFVYRRGEPKNRNYRKKK